MTSTCAAAVGLCGLGTALAAPAGAAPTDASASETISELESQGYRVILSKVGTKAMDDCTVSAVRQGRTVTAPQIPVGAASITSFNPGQNLQYTTVYVDLDCRR
ncbi:hypothetical protein BA059_26485 [Mycolicibacterium sp. (ex Dasyatis americana)]|uniref:DUF732 domain-containing protein n=1 Tax=Mycobacterium syngnathidarum TaxID=1908205 RepID=A0A1Q9WA37_9MYCO|nr:hypothetical protein [Mycobacterium sp. DBP42]OFB36041.1 hypothetical protein BA059_26485 [Mycolicibacterium sp. (ex Dasyatis americana)]OHU01221.1 hypothetical protein BKG61_11280 [Mycobacterium syngnathidarum]OLT95658.1 hypothetical protein BKG60_16670 [Mycobacterium syngnathidarum]TMS52727.1 hypothetical protein E0T84_14710 [Mycobacterium sp. DBP42]